MAAEIQREEEERQKEAEEGGRSNEDEGVQLADSGQSTRTPTTEWAQEERSWAERRGRSEGGRWREEVQWSSEGRQEIQDVCREKIRGVTVQICERMGAKFGFLRENRRKKRSFGFSKVGRGRSVNSIQCSDKKGGSRNWRGSQKKTLERDGKEGGGTYGCFCIKRNKERGGEEQQRGEKREASGGRSCSLQNISAVFVHAFWVIFPYFKQFRYPNSRVLTQDLLAFTLEI